MQSKLSVLQVIPKLNISGAEQGCIDIANYLTNNNHNSLIITSSGSRIDEVSKNGTRVIIMPVHSKNPIIIIINIFRIQKIIKSNNIDIIHVRSRAPAWTTYFIKKFNKIKLISTFHGTYNFNNKLKKFYNSIMLKTDGTIAISKFIQSHIKEKYSSNISKLKVIPRGVDLNIFNIDLIQNEQIDNLNTKFNIRQNAIKIILPARLTGWKGHLIVIDAINIFKKKSDLDIQVLFIGPDNNINFKNKIIKKINDLNLTEVIQICGPSTEMSSIYAFSDIVLFPSTDPEAFGRISIEAQAMGKFVIASNHGGSKETIIDGLTGYLYDPNNPEDLCSMLGKAISTKKHDLGNDKMYSVNHIKENYTKENMCERTLDFYKEVLNS